MANFNITLRSYRAFRDEAQLRVRPLTMLFGNNQAGKSTLLRLLPLIADSLYEKSGPLNLDSSSLRGATFKELGWMGRGNFSMTPEFLFSGGSENNGPRLRIQFSDDSGLIVNRFVLSSGEDGSKFEVFIDAESNRDGKAFNARYAGRHRGNAWEGELAFDNLIPKGLPEEAERIAREIESILAPLSKIQWLRANRLIDGGVSQTKTRCCQPDGSDLAALIQGGSERAILDDVGKWLSEQDGLGNDVILQASSGSRPQFLISAPGKESLPINLAGEGVRSLLPILICLAWAESDHRSKPTFLAIEEPEAHIHPNLQVALFNRIIKTVKAGVPVVLETHSVYLLRAMQLAVLNGEIEKEAVGLHWVSQGKDGAAAVTHVEVGDDATLSGWRPFLFEKEQELAHKIIDLRWQRGMG